MQNGVLVREIVVCHPISGISWFFLIFLKNKRITELIKLIIPSNFGIEGNGLHIRVIANIIINNNSKRITVIRPINSNRLRVVVTVF